VSEQEKEWDIPKIEELFRGLCILFVKHADQNLLVRDLELEIESWKSRESFGSWIAASTMQSTGFVVNGISPSLVQPMKPKDEGQ